MKTKFLIVKSIAHKYGHEFFPPKQKLLQLDFNKDGNDKENRRYAFPCLIFS
jgi:hypothetical protein